MQTIELPGLADRVRTLPTEGAGRARQLKRIVDLQAATEAAAALQATAARTREGLVARLLATAVIVLDSAKDGAHPGDDAMRDHLRDQVASPELLSLVPGWIRELREVASFQPETGACAVATALDLWSWTVAHFRNRQDSPDAIDELALALCPLLAARCLAINVAAANAPGTASNLELRRALCHVYAAHAAAQAGTACAELVFGYRRHLVWDAEGCASCYAGDDIDDLEALMPGIASGARASGDVVEADGSHAQKAGPCVRFDGVETFTALRARLDGCLTGARTAKDRAAAAIAATATSKGRA